MKKLIILITCISIFAQCKKEKTAEPETAQTTNTPATGSITGKITQFDCFGSTYTLNLNTTTVSLFGTNYSTVTDVSGNYTLSNIPAGIYSIATDKPNCRTLQMQQISFVGNGTLYENSYTCDIPTHSFTSSSIIDTVVSPGNHYVKIRVSLTALSTNVGGVLLIGNSNSIDITDPTSYSTLFNYSIPANTTLKQVYSAPATSGSTIYYRVYPFSNSSGSSYFDYALGKSRFIAYGTALPTASITIQ